MGQVVAGESALAEIVSRLVQAVAPDRIILFGSHTKQTAGPNSDLDLLLVKESDAPLHRRAIPAYRALHGLGVPLDIIWYTPEEIENWAAVRNHVATRALREGRVIYEKQH